MGSLLSKIMLCTATVFFFSRAYSQDAGQLTRRADGLLDNRKYDSAILFYAKAIKADPKSYLAFYGRATAYAKHKDRLYNPAVSDYTSAIKLLPPDSIRTRAIYYTERGIVLEKKQARDSAFLDFNEAILADPTLQKAYMYRGERYYDRYNFELAIKDFTRAIQLDSSQASAWRARSRTFYGLDEADSALSDINMAMRLDSAYINYNYRGVFYTRLGKYEAAVNDFMVSIKKDYAHGNPYINIIAPLVRMKKIQEAAAFYNIYQNLLARMGYGAGQFMAFIDGGNAYRFYRHYVNAVDLLSDNKPAEALQLLDSASLEYGTEVKAETKRCYADVLALRGYIQGLTGLLDDARACYEQALILDPRQPDVEEALQNIQISQALSKSRSIDNTKPVIDFARADMIDIAVPVSDAAQVQGSDSVTFRVRGLATDETGIREIAIDSMKVNNLGVIGKECLFTDTIRKRKSDYIPITILATDSAGNKSAYTFDAAQMRGAKVTNTDSTEETFGNYYAILIAEKDYADPDIKSLNYPIRDAGKLKKILTEKYTFPLENVDTLYNRSREEILETIIARCKALGKNDNLLIFYAGHGDTTHDINDHVDGYLVPTSAKKGLTSYFITSEEIKKALLKSNAKHVLFLLDACYSGAFTRGDNDATPAEIRAQWKSQSRKVMTSGNLEAVPDESIFIKHLTDFLNDNEASFVTAKDVWNYVDNHMREAIKSLGSSSFYNPQYSAITGVEDKGGTFIFVLKKKN